MTEKMRIRLTNRFNPRVFRRTTPQHPEAPPTQTTYNQQTHIRKLDGKLPKGKMIRRRPKTAQEVRDGYRGLVNFMHFFAGDRKLAAEATGVSKGTIDRCLKQGWLTPYVALMAQKIPEMPYYPAGLCPYIQYDWEWAEAKKELARAINNAGLAGKRMSAYHGTKNQVR